MISFFRKLGWLARHRSKEYQLDDELQFHLEQEAAERRTAGMSDQEASRAARRDLGNLGLVREYTRSAWSWNLVEQFMQDVRYGVRTLRANPAFTSLAALSLALGIGANTAIYSFMDALLLRSLPVANPSSLVVLKWHVAKETDDFVLHSISGQMHDDSAGAISPVFPFPAFESLRKSNQVLSHLFAYRPAKKLTVLVQGRAEVVPGEYVSGGFFEGLGVVPSAGRLIASYDDRAGAQPMIVLSHNFAEERFGDIARAVDKQVMINNIPFTVIGVAPPEFFGIDPGKAPRLYLPLHADLLLDPERAGSPGRYQDEHYYWNEMMGRLRPGVTRAQAESELASRFHAWVDTTASDRERQNLPQLILQSGSTGLDNLRRNFSEPFTILLAMVGLILAIACANIANLLLARATARAREMAIRLSMGAGRWRVIRQLLTESVLLALIGGAAGILLAIWGIRLLGAALGTAGDPFPLRPELNAGVLAVSLLLTLSTGVLFGLAPALRATRIDPMPVLRENRTGSHSRALFGLSFGRLLVISEMAICLLLLVVAGLFVRTLSNLHSLDVGFQRANVLLFKVNAHQAGYRSAEMLAYYKNLGQHLSLIPGVRSVSTANSPLIGDGAWGWPVVPLGQEKPKNAPTGHGSGASRDSTRVLGAGAGFFSTMGIPILSGREFDQRDHAGSPPVAIVNEAWTKVNLNGLNPVGRQVTSFGLNDKPHQIQIIGLAKNARYDNLTGDFPAVVYMPFEQNLDVPFDEMTFFLRTTADPLAVAGAVREIVQQLDPRIPVAGLTTQVAQIDREIVPETLFARLCSGFAILALAIACVGLYGTTSYAVARRTSEIGIRMALGAQRGTVVWMVLRDVLLLAVAGLAISLPAAFGASKLVASLLFGVKPGDPAAMALAAAILLAAAVAAGYLPAWKASRIDPMTAVRHE